MMLFPQPRLICPDVELEVKKLMFEDEYWQLCMAVPVHVCVTVGRVDISEGIKMETMLKGMVVVKLTLILDVLNTV